MPSLRFLVAALPATAIVLGMAGCSDARSVAPPVEDLTAEANVPRLVHDPRTVAVRVTNHGTEPVWVREVELVTESFAPAGPVEKGVVIQPGTAKALTVVPGEARCGGEAAPPLAPATARLVLAAGAAEPTEDQWQTMELPVTEADRRWESRLHADCAVQIVTAAADVRLEGLAPQPDGRLQGRLVVERRSGDQPLTVHDVYGSTLYTLTADLGEGEPGRLPPGEARLEFPVTADTAQCGAHAIADSKYPYAFRIVLTIGDAARLPAAIATDPTGQDQLRQMWQVRCGQ